ncbi:VOC family protein [Fictibacillus sp. NRS-1165]|uniref:VOC family protein n=1 Tax=Fictibacillus sp. NRS-1165 TaxID=3144463 RepID=UPI003D1AD98A
MNFHTRPHTFVNHVQLIVEDLDRSLSFYKDILGFSVLKEEEGAVFLTLDGQKSILSVVQPENAKPKQPRTSGLYHFALLVPNRKELAKVLRHFISIGYPLQGASDHLVSEALYLADPDGNGIEIYADRDAEEWKWENGQVVMTTEPLDSKGLLVESAGSSFDGLPKETIMGHLHLHVSNLQEAEMFYCEGLGFEVVLRYSNHALFISTGGYHHHLGLNIWNGQGAPAPDEHHAGLKQFTVVYPSSEARDEACARLRNLGYGVQQLDESLFVKDPSGTLMELARG